MEPLLRLGALVSVAPDTRQHLVLLVPSPTETLYAHKVIPGLTQSRQPLPRQAAAIQDNNG